MRIGMDQLSNADYTTQFSHHFGNFQIVAKNMHTGKERQMFHDLAIFGHRVRHRHTVCQMGQFIILNTMTRRNVDKACTDGFDKGFRSGYDEGLTAGRDDRSEEDASGSKKTQPTSQICVHSYVPSATPG